MMKISLIALASVCSFSLIGCISDPKVVEEDFGKSVKQMINAQIADPVVAADPDLEGPQLIDGVAASESIIGYRKAAVRPKREQSIDFSVFQ